jgi:Fe-S oxidoreductase
MTVMLPREKSDEAFLHTLQEACGRNFSACYQCGTCTAACPFSFAPQRVMRHLQLGQVEEALALGTTWECASCTTCTRECPHDMDPARILRALRDLREGGETEGPAARFRLVAERSYRGHAHRLRARIFAGIHILSRLGSCLAPASNRLLSGPIQRLLLHHLAGIHRARTLPTFRRPAFPEWFAGHVPLGDGGRGEVVLFHDTFMDYENPEVGRAATELLETAGFRVALSNTVCCGRPMLSKGYTRLATAHARANVEALHEHVKSGSPVVGCEPSCLLTIRHEYPGLLRGTEWEGKAREVAEITFLLDEFLDRLDSRGELGLEFQGAGRDGGRVIFHGHCQQKTSADPQASLRLLGRAGYRAEMPHAGCCGMAGAFGFEREHYQASQDAWERGLGVALRKEEAPVIIVGTSCRQQVAHFGHRGALHLAEFLRRELVVSPPARSEARGDDVPGREVEQG